MFTLVGIDEAGYGPKFGPLTVGRAVLAVPKVQAPADPEAWLDTKPDLWSTLSAAVSKLPDRHGQKLAVNDSKKLKTKAAGLKHLERGVLAFADLAGHKAATAGRLVQALHDDRTPDPIPGWYGPMNAPLPTCVTPGEIAIDRGMLRRAAQAAGVEVPDLAVTPVFEPRFNHLVQMTRSKAAASFTAVARHLGIAFKQHGESPLLVAVDRQSGRTHYAPPLRTAFPEAHLTLLEESPARSAYLLEDHARRMVVVFQTSAETEHLPVALASMACKYVRELLMAGFNGYFGEHAPQVAPTAGYGSDAKRFHAEIAPHLARIGIPEHELVRQA